MEIKVIRAKFIGTTNEKFDKVYKNETGTLYLLPLGFSPQFEPDNAIKLHTLTMSWLVGVDGLTLKTRNSTYIFEEIYET
jgi:hypothetical protein